MSRRRTWTRSLPLLLTAVGISAAFSLYVFGLAWLQSRHSLYDPADLFVPRLIDVGVFIWLFWVGSSVGSFLNVVAWRMPRGQGVNGRSYCPRCRTRLKARDNFPVFGWLALRGRCRTCHLPISPRYPIVEAAVGSTITLVGIAELYRLSLPAPPLVWPRGPLWTPVVDAPLLWTLLYHTVALALSWAMGLIRIDGHRLPRRLIAFAMAALILPVLAYPTLMVVPWQVEIPAQWRPEGILDAMMRVITALVAAVLVGRYLSHGICPGADPKLDPLGKRTVRLFDLIAVISVAAIVFGWQSTPAVVLIASFVAIPLRRRIGCDSLGGLAIAMPIAMTIQFVLWRALHQSQFYPTAGGTPGPFIASVALLFLVPLWLHEPKPTDLDREDDAPGEADDEDEEEDAVAGRIGETPNGNLHVTDPEATAEPNSNDDSPIPRPPQEP